MSLQSSTVGRGAGLVSILALLAVAGVPAGPCVADGKARLAVGFDSGGLASIRYGGAELLVDGRPRVASAVLEEIGHDKDGQRTWAFTQAGVASPRVSFDAAGRRLRHSYEWGTVELAYAPATDRLAVTVTITNHSKQTLADFDLTLMRLALPAAAPDPNAPKDPKKKPAPVGGIRPTLDNLVVVAVPFADARLLACCETMDPPLHFGLAAPSGKDRQTAVRAHGGVYAPRPGEYTIDPHGRPRIEAGKSGSWTFSLRFAPAAGDDDKLLADLYEKFRGFHGPMHDWPDRRPIGMLMMGSGYHRSKTNPRGWFNEPKIDVTSPEGRADFHKRALKYAERSVETLRTVGAQGMIAWDIEGAENPHPITYIGDPRMVKTFAPEMDEVADEFFAKFREAGFRTGVCIRPSKVYLNPKDSKWSHGTGSDGMEGRGSRFPQLRPKDLPAWRYFPIVERLMDKIDYARKRWGCTIFYIDTNGTWQPVGEKTTFKWFLLNAHMWKRIQQKYPDVLLIPELTGGDGFYHAAQFAFTAPYFELDLGAAATPAHIRKLLPKAFSIINVADGPFEKRRDDLVAGVKSGDILMFRGWFGCSVNPKVVSVYEEVRTGSKPTPPAPKEPTVLEQLEKAIQ